MGEYIFRCDLSKQYRLYRDELAAAIDKMLNTGVYTLGSEVRSFEEEFAGYIGRSYAIGVASGTDALILALKASGIREGDGVITTAYAPTPVATAIVLAGGRPVFADIEEDTCLMDPGSVEEQVSRKTRFMIVVQLFGYICDMPAMRKIAAANDLTVVEDAAQAHGSSTGGKKAGSLGDISCFSFYPTKNLGGYGDGGMVLTDDKDVEKALRLLRNYGKKNNPFDSEVLGYNSRLDEIQAALLRVKLKYLDMMDGLRSGIVGLYKEGLKGLPLVFLKERSGIEPNYHILTVLCRERRDALMAFLEKRDIQTNVYYPRPLYAMRAFREYTPKGRRLPVSEKVSKEAIALPLYPELGRDKVSYIIDAIRGFYK